MTKNEVEQIVIDVLREVLWEADRLGAFKPADALKGAAAVVAARIESEREGDAA